MILRILGLSEEGRIVFNKDFKNTDRNTSREINLRCPDVSKAKSLIDFKPQVSLEKAIEKIIKIGNYTEDWSYKR